MGPYRIITIALLVAIAAVAAVPLLVLMDLSGGGDGYGLCPEGLTSCRTSYFSGPELILGLVGIIFLLLGTLQVVRWLERRRTRRS